jgi:hypothetical protein
MECSFVSRIAGLAWLGVLTASCGGSDVSVGSEAGSGLDRCVGAADGCSALVRSQPAEPMAPQACAETMVAQLTVDYSFAVAQRLCPLADCDWQNGEICPTAPCSVSIEAAKPAPDGSIWVAASTSFLSDSAQQQLWLGHVGEGGADLGFFKVASGTALRNSSVGYSADLAVDAESRVYLAVNVRDPGPDADAEIRDHASIHRYEADGRVGEGELELPGVAHTLLVLGNDGRIVIAADAMNLQRRAIAAVIEQDGDLVWSQPKITSSGSRSLGVQGVGVDAAGDVFVYTHRSYSKVVKGEFGVVMFDAEGRRIWERDLAGGFADSYPSRFGVDGEGNVTIAGYPPSSSSEAHFGEPLRLVNLDVAGAVRWTLDVPAFGIDLSVARDGDVYVPGFESLARISKDGVCERLAWPERGSASGHAEVGPDGRLYFFGQQSVGRYRPLAGSD